MSTQSRVHAGVPTGGQFATSARAESGVSLSDAEFEASRQERAASMRAKAQRKHDRREARTRQGVVIPPDAASAVDRFNPDGPSGYRANGVPGAHVRATREAAEDDWLVAKKRPEIEAALAPALTMNRVEAEQHVKDLIDAAAADDNVWLIGQYATVASTPGWEGVGYIQNYPGVRNASASATEYLPTSAASTRIAVHAYRQSVEAGRRVWEAERAQATSPVTSQES